MVVNSVLVLFDVEDIIEMLDVESYACDVCFVEGVGEVLAVFSRDVVPVGCSVVVLLVVVDRVDEIGESSALSIRRLNLHCLI